MNNVVFVGQAPSRDSDPNRPLTGRTGQKLADLLGIHIDDFENDFERVNLNRTWRQRSRAGKGDAFDHDVGRVVAEKMRFDHRRLVLLGKKVASCFGFTDPEPLSNTGNFFFLPHPSGLNLWWNSPANRKLAKAKLTKFIYG